MHEGRTKARGGEGTGRQTGCSFLSGLAGAFWSKPEQERDLKTQKLLRVLALKPKSPSFLAHFKLTKSKYLLWAWPSNGTIRNCRYSEDWILVLRKLTGGQGIFSFPPNPAAEVELYFYNFSILQLGVLDLGLLNTIEF